MKIPQPANEPAKMNRDPVYCLSPILPGKEKIGPLKDMAQHLVAASAGLEGRVAKETAMALGDRLRLVNSYYSNLIEGHKTTIFPTFTTLQRSEKNIVENDDPAL